MDKPVYVGRFAPSPTGPLHFGSLVAALASFLDARAVGGRWLVRIEDLDPPRETPAAARFILDQLTGFGLHYDGEVLYQSTRLDAYGDALQRLRDMQLTFPCTCTRKDLGKIYGGRCRGRSFDETEAPYAIRCRVDATDISIIDRISGRQHWNLSKNVGDFIVKRKDGLFAYQLAVVVDDAFQGVTDVVRGTDLLGSTPRQVYLASCLGLPHQRYAHLPVITGADGAKLSKQTHAAAVDPADAVFLLRRALLALGQPDPGNSATVTKLIETAINNWRIDRVPNCAGLPLSGLSIAP
ncbi:MAG: tRNA glutamyl-Q(34) synthetase GluQRS [Pseudomonadota bacterium]